MRFDRGGCLTVLGLLLLAGVVGFVLMALAVRALDSALRDPLPENVRLLVLVPVGMILWCVFSIGALLPLGALASRGQAHRLQQFLSRPMLTDEQFGRLFPACPALAVEVRAEIERLVGDPETARRLLPADPLAETLSLAGSNPDMLEWADFLFRLEELPAHTPDRPLDEDMSVAELVAWCSGAPEPRVKSEE